MSAGFRQFETSRNETHAATRPVSVYGRYCWKCHGSDAGFRSQELPPGPLPDAWSRVLKDVGMRVVEDLAVHEPVARVGWLL
jgi:hypothetical protein